MTDFQTLQRRRNMVVGGFVLLAFAAFIWMLVKFRNLPLFATQFRSYEVFVSFPDAPGVQKDTPVLYCGYQIGRVMAVDPPRRVSDKNGQPYHAVRVTLAIENKYDDIPDHAEIQIVKRGLGSSYIQLIVDPDKPVDKFLAMGTDKEGQVSSASEFFPPAIQKKLENLVDSISLLADNTNAIIGDADNQQHIKKTLEHLTLATAQANDTLRSLQGFADTGTEKLHTAGAGLDQTLKSVTHLSEVGAERIEAIAYSLDQTLRDVRQILHKINEGDGSAAKLLNDGRLYENLLDSSRELELALDQIKRWAADVREKGIRIKW